MSEIVDALAPDNGTVLRRVRRWNIQNGFALTWAFWLVVAVLIWEVVR